MKVAFGADHAGYALKESLIAAVRALGHEALDCGTHSEESVDYPDLALTVARSVAGGDVPLGVLVCGTGVGMAMVANKVEGVRAANCHDAYCAAMARAHNDANILTLGARVIGAGVAEEILRVFLATSFEAGRHTRRLEKFPAGGLQAGA